jgi:hypothetical protein
MKSWKKFMAVGCSHGSEIDPDAREAVMRFKRKWKPHTTIHLGDFLDLAAFRAGAVRDSSDPDHARSVSDDLACGLDFLEEYRPNLVCYGNHEARLYKFAASSNALLAHAARLTIDEIEKTLAKFKARSIPYDIRSYFELGNTKFLHGYMHNTAAIRDHAETYGDCVLAHLHRVGWERARSLDGPSGYCVGMLARFGMEYAATRRATLSWSQGFAYGYYSDDFCQVNLVQRRRGMPWLLPL